MATPNAIKPTVFFARGYAPDVRLHVLDRGVYHVHSVILKLNSNFFFKFLDSPEKQAAAATSASGATSSGHGQFKYEWITQVDDDGTWSLVSAGGGKIESRNMHALTASLPNITDQVFVFECFLQALYGNPYHLAGLNHLLIMTEFADYYCALPAVSRTLTAAIYHIKEIDWVENAKHLASIAMKFRHRELLEDSVNIIAGRRSNFNRSWEDGLENVEPAMQKLVSMVSGRIDSVVAGEHTRIIEAALENKGFRDSLSKITGYKSLPEYYRKVYQLYPDSFNHPKEKFVLAKNLTFDRRLESQPGQNVYRDYFLCGWLEEADIPWDPTQQDW